MFEAGVDDFFDPAQLGAPRVFEVVEARVHVLPEIANPGVRARDSGIDGRNPPVVDRDADQNRQRGHPDRHKQLRAVHRLILPKDPAI